MSFSLFSHFFFKSFLIAMKRGRDDKEVVRVRLVNVPKGVPMVTPGEKSEFLVNSTNNKAMSINFALGPTFALYNLKGVNRRSVDSRIFIISATMVVCHPTGGDMLVDNWSGVAGTITPSPLMITFKTSNRHAVLQWDIQTNGDLWCYMPPTTMAANLAAALPQSYVATKRFDRPIEIDFSQGGDVTALWPLFNNSATQCQFLVTFWIIDDF
jgi:hypothetical protein